MSQKTSRRGFLAEVGLGGAAAWLSGSAQACGQVPAASRTSESHPGRLYGLELRQAIDLHSLTGCAAVRGFNYQPSWGHDGRTIWGKFDPARFRLELARGQELFPWLNTVRLWLSWSAFKDQPAATKTAVSQALEICGQLKLLTIPTLFMRWIGNPPFDPVRFADMAAAGHEDRFGPFLDAIVTPQKGNPFVLAWDLCNEPTENTDQLAWYGETKLDFVQVMNVQHAWLTAIRDGVRRRDPQALTCLGMITMRQDRQTRERFESLSDIVTPHIYEIHCKGQPGKLEDRFDQRVRDYVDDLRQRGVRKPILVSEAFWGDVDDAKRAAMIGPSARTFRRHGLGYLAYGLWESPVSDLHSARFGPVGGPGNMCFINSDGSLRPGHDVLNDI